jgi:hypothetical protein
MKAGATRIGRVQGKAKIMAKKTHIRLAAVVAALLSATPALADQITNFPGGSVHTWTGQHGESFTVIRNNRTGAKVTTVDRHDGRGPLPFVPEKAKITKKFGGSVYDKDTGMTTTRVVGPTGWVQMVEAGNTLRDHGDWMPTDNKGFSRGTMFNPLTNETTTLVMQPGMYGRMVEHGNTMRDHEDMVMRKPAKKMGGGGGGMPGGGMMMPGGGGMVPPGMPGAPPWHAAGSSYDQETGKTTTVSKGPNGSASMVEDGNTMDQHANRGRRLPRGHASGSLYDPETNTTTSVSQGPNGYARSVEMGNTLGAH